MRFAVFIALLWLSAYGLAESMTDERASKLAPPKGLENIPPHFNVHAQLMGPLRGYLINALWMETAFILKDPDEHWRLPLMFDVLAHVQPYFVSAHVHAANVMARDVSVRAENSEEHYLWVKHALDHLEKVIPSNLPSDKLWRLFQTRGDILMSKVVPDASFRDDGAWHTQKYLADTDRHPYDDAIEAYDLMVQQPQSLKGFHNVPIRARRRAALYGPPDKRWGWMKEVLETWQSEYDNDPNNATVWQDLALAKATQAYLLAKEQSSALGQAMAALNMLRYDLPQRFPALFRDMAAFSLQKGEADLFLKQAVGPEDDPDRQALYRGLQNLEWEDVPLYIPVSYALLYRQFFDEGDFDFYLMDLLELQLSKPPTGQEERFRDLMKGHLVYLMQFTDSMIEIAEYVAKDQGFDTKSLLNDLKFRRKQQAESLSGLK